jgi:hypothetical protein
MPFKLSQRLDFSFQYWPKEIGSGVRLAYVFSVLPASRWQDMAVRRFGQ